MFLFTRLLNNISGKYQRCVIGLNVLQENKTSVACLVGSGLNFIFH